MSFGSVIKMHGPRLLVDGPTILAAMKVPSVGARLIEEWIEPRPVASVVTLTVGPRTIGLIRWPSAAHVAADEN